MFDSKLPQLFPPVQKMDRGAPSVNAFVQAANVVGVTTTSGNGSVKLSSSLDAFVDQFNNLGVFKSMRSFAQIEKDCELLWAEDPTTAVKFILYLRTITRKTTLLSGEVTEVPQKGGELKHEAIMRMIWLSQKSPTTFWQNIGLFIALGSWHDVFTMLQHDLVFNGWEGRKLDWTLFGSLLLQGLTHDSSSELVKKYLPHVKARSVCRTVEAQANCLIAKWLCAQIFGPKVSTLSYKLYRNLKTSGTAHQWQQLISQRKFTALDFGKIHGRALNLLVRGKFLDNQGLKDRYAEWVKAPEHKVKYTGFVHELFQKLPRTLSDIPHHVQNTINKQFDTLVEKGRSDKEDNSTNFIVVRDTSTSMNSVAPGTTMTCNQIGKALALYFSKFLKGPFANNFIEFNTDAKMHHWKGDTPLEQWYNDSAHHIGSTNFLSVINLFATIKGLGVDDQDFPTGILCISDSEFDPSELGISAVAHAKQILLDAGFSSDFVNRFQIVLWNLQNRFYGAHANKFETTAETPGVHYFSGYSASVISFINGQDILTARQVFDLAMDQEVLNRVSVVHA